MGGDQRDIYLGGEKVEKDRRQTTLRAIDTEDTRSWRHINNQHQQGLSQKIKKDLHVYLSTIVQCRCLLLNEMKGAI